MQESTTAEGTRTLAVPRRRVRTATGATEEFRSAVPPAVCTTHTGGRRGRVQATLPLLIELRKSCVVFVIFDLGFPQDDGIL